MTPKPETQQHFRARTAKTLALTRLLREAQAAVAGETSDYAQGWRAALAHVKRLSEAKDREP